MKYEKKLEQIKEKIRTINPEITDELLDLLYEYNCTRQRIIMNNSLNDENFNKAIQEVISNRLVRK